MENNLTVSSPHIRHFDSTRSIMGDVLWGLGPAAVYGSIMFGLRAVLVIVTCVATAVLAEFLWNLILKKPQTIGDLSAVVTGMILGMNLSPLIPLWMAAIGSVIAIIIVKQMFGGLGHNFANPVVVARIVLMVSFPAAMTRFAEPISDVVTSATPLSGGSYSGWLLFWGTHSGSIGETSVALLLVGALFLLFRRIITPTIPACFIGTVALLTWLTGGNVVTSLLTGGLFLAAIFMATDYTTSPYSTLGKVIFGVGCGVITFVIRKYGALPEGVSCAILVMNILTPHINRLPARSPFGSRVKQKGGRHSA